MSKRYSTRSRCLGALILAGAFILPAPAQLRDSSLNQIETLVRSRQYPQALRMIASALQRTPRDSRLWTLKGIVFSLQGQDGQASAAFEHALAISPDDLPALQGEVQLLFRAQDPRAIPLLQRILKLSPRDATAHEMLATLEARADDCADAVNQFELSANIGEHPASLEAYGTCLLQTGNSAKAIKLFQQWANSAPDNAYPKYDLAVILFNARQYQAALDSIQPLLKNGQTDPDLLSLASDIYEAIGDTPRAVALLRQAIVLKPSDPNLYVAFTLLCLDHESYQVGIDMINAGLQRLPDASVLFISRGLLYAELDNFSRAEEDFDRSQQLDPHQSLTAYAIDLAELQKYHFDVTHSAQAIEQIRRQLKTHPNSAELHYLLAKLLSTQGASSSSNSYEEAKQEAMAAIRLKPGFVEARDLLATIDLHEEDYADAEQQCRIALQQSPDNPRTIYHLIAALRHSKQPDQQTELQSLVKRLSDLERTSLQQETAKKKFKLVEAPPSE